MTNGKVSRARRKQQPQTDREVSGVVLAICRVCSKQKRMQSVYRMCDKCIRRQILEALEEEF